MYDRFGHAGLGGAATGGFDPNAFSGFEDILGGLGDIFGFGDAFGGRRRGGPQRGADLRYDLEISFEEAAKGTEAALQIPRQEIVRDLQGKRRRAGHFSGDVPAVSGTRADPISTGVLHRRADVRPMPWNRLGRRQAVSDLSRRRARPEGKEAERPHPCRHRHRTAIALERRRRGRPRRWPPRRPLRRRARAGAPVLPAGRQRSVLRDSAQLPDRGAGRRHQGSDARRRTSRSRFPRARRAARRSACAAAGCPM